MPSPGSPTTPGSAGDLHHKVPVWCSLSYHHRGNRPNVHSHSLSFLKVIDEIVGRISTTCAFMCFLQAVTRYTSLDGGRLTFSDIGIFPSSREPILLGYVSLYLQCRFLSVTSCHIFHHSEKESFIGDYCITFPRHVCKNPRELLYTSRVR